VPTDFNRILLQRLLAAGALSSTQVEQVEQAQREQGLSLRTAVVQLGCMDDATFLRHWATLHDVPIVDLDTFPVDPDAIALVPRDTCVELTALPLRCTQDTLTVALAEPYDVFAVDSLHFVSNRTVQVAFAAAGEVRAAIERYYPGAGPLPEPIDVDVQIGPAVQAIDEIVRDAIQRRASHIHFEPDALGLRIRMRIDGALHELRRLPSGLRRMVAARIKILACLDIAERRLPQAGRAQVKIEGRDVELWASTLPTSEREEHVLLQIVEPAQVPPGLEGSGLEADTVERFKACLATRAGLILVCGPRQSGRTTTLYQALETVAREGLSAMAAEYAVERRLPGVTQLEMRSDIGFDAGAALRAMLRQDADAILLAELSNYDVAMQAVRASLEGRLVLCGMHVRNAVAAVGRLADMGIEPYLIAASLRAVLAQRLVRRLCTACREPAALPEPYAAQAPAAYRPRGCPECGNTGYRGRTAVGELLVVDDALGQAIVRQAPPGELSALARSRGMRSLWQAALAQVAAGNTAFSEALAAAPPDRV